MRGAYVATPLPTVELLLPYDWDPSWPYPGAHPPGYDTPRDPELVFWSPPTPEEEIKVDEEITIGVILREETHDLPLPDPEDGSSDVTWYAELTWFPGMAGTIIWTATSSWSNVSGYPGATKTFTPPLTEDDEGKYLVFYAVSTVVYDKESFSVSAEYDVEITPLIPVAFEGYLVFDSWEVTAACLTTSHLKTSKSGTSRRDWPAVGITDYSAPWGEEDEWWSGTSHTQLPEVASTYQHEDGKRIDVSISSLLTDGMYSLAWFIAPYGGFSGNISCYAKVTYDDGSSDTWTATLTVSAGGDPEGLGLVIDRRYGGYVEASSGWGSPD